MTDLAISTLPFLETLANARVGFLTAFFNLITYLGDEKLFVVISLIVLWCFSKRGGLFMLTVGFAASSIGQTLKALFRIPRPWNLGEKPFDKADAIARSGYPEEGGLLNKIMNKLGDAADGWSFPSGHTLISVGTYGSLAAWFRNRWFQILGVALAVLIPFTRLYLGVHTPVDIIAGALLAIALIFILRPVFASEGNGRVRAVLIGNAVLTILLLVVVYLVQPAELAGEDAANYASGIKNLWQLIGATLAIWLAFEADEGWLHYDTRAVWWAQLLKIAGGCIIVLALQMGIQKVLGYSSKELTLETMTRMGYIACLANFVAMGAATILWPMTFKWFSKLGYKGKHARR